MQGRGPFANQYALKSKHFADRALKYDATKKEVVLSCYDSSDRSDPSDPSFYFSLQPVPRRDQQNKYKFIYEETI